MCVPTHSTDLTNGDSNKHRPAPGPKILGSGGFGDVCSDLFFPNTTFGWIFRVMGVRRDLIRDILYIRDLIRDPSPRNFLRFLRSRRVGSTIYRHCVCPERCRAGFNHPNNPPLTSWPPLPLPTSLHQPQDYGKRGKNSHGPKPVPPHPQAN